MKIFLYSILFSLIIVSCKKDDDSPISKPINTPSDQIDLLNLKNGQKTYYVNYTGACNSSADNFEYSGDTISLVVVQESNKWFFEETYSRFSKAVLNGLVTTDPIRYEILPIENNIVIPERMTSQLFFFYGDDTLRLVHQNKVRLHQEYCILAHEDDEPFIGNDVGYFDSYDVGPLNMENKTAVSCVPAILDLEAYLIYDQNRLYMSHTLGPIWSSPGKTINGWVALD